MTDEELDSLSRKHRMRGTIIMTAYRLVKTAEDKSVHVNSFHRIIGAAEVKLPDVQQQVDYCVRAGYLDAVVEKRAARDDGKIIGYRPTIKGIQLAEGDIADATVEFL